MLGTYAASLEKQKKANKINKDNGKNSKGYEGEYTKEQALKAANRGEMGARTKARQAVIALMIQFSGGKMKTILTRARELQPLIPLLKRIGSEYIMVRALPFFFFLISNRQFF